ncbi:MAG: hypothetical protein JRJ49_10960 [Deltaproteobacteria bacterium]|nr:hypothetical protein [Deltaproteobacteria bacterium]
MDIKLNMKEAQILKNALSHADYNFVSFDLLGKNKLCLSINNDQADKIRNICAEYLQLIGFDENYAPTEEGKILEVLIDKFFTDADQTYL